MAICFLGDIHFRADHSHFMKAAEDFLSWFSNWEMNNESNHLVIAGDVVHTANNGGIVVRYLERFANASKFKSLHIVAGNHDKRLLAGRWQLAYDFYQEEPNRFLYEQESTVEVENNTLIMCPYYVGVNSQGKTMKELYSTLYERYGHLDPTKTIVVGHFGDPISSFGDGADCIANLDKLECKKVLGHIHTRVTPSINIGSVIAQSKAENDDRRAAWILENGEWREEKLPIFIEFLEASYKGELPESKALTPVYTILDCVSESVARAKFGDIFIRRTIAGSAETSFSRVEMNSTSPKNMDIKTLFEEFREQQKGAYPPEIFEECKKCL